MIGYQMYQYVIKEEFTYLLHLKLNHPHLPFANF